MSFAGTHSTQSVWPHLHVEILIPNMLLALPNVKEIVWRVLRLKSPSSFMVSSYEDSLLSSMDLLTISLTGPLFFYSVTQVFSMLGLKKFRRCFGQEIREETFITGAFIVQLGLKCLRMVAKWNVYIKLWCLRCFWDLWFPSQYLLHTHTISSFSLPLPAQSIFQ